MKKFLSLIMAVVIVCTASIYVSAETYTGTKEDMVAGDTATADVSVAYVDSTGETVTTSGTVYSVDVSFEDLKFNWKITSEVESEELVWDPDTHTYKNGTGDDAASIAWELPANISNAVTVKNHSNADIKVTALFGDSKEAEVNGCKATLATLSDENLESAAATHYGTPDKAETATYSLTPSGSPADPTNTNFKIGTITVTISAVTAE